MKKPTLAAGFLLLSFLFPFKATAAKFNQLYVFGDSLSDTGNVYTGALKTLGVGLPAAPYYPGRFSNYFNWIDYLSQDLGLNPNPYLNVVFDGASSSQGINYAFGGATTGTENTILPSFIGLQQEIGSFTLPLQAANISANPNALYIVWAGANDYLPTNSAFKPFDKPDQTIQNLSFAVSSLAAAGAKNILVPNLPDLGKIPLMLGSQNSNDLSSLIKAHNSALATSLSGLSQNLGSGVNLIPLDVNSLFEQALSNPQQYGFTNVTNGCLLVQCTNPNEYVFWDDKHPTSATHRLIADLALSKLETNSVPEPSAEIGILAIGAVGAVSVLGRKRKQYSSAKVKV